MSWFLIAITAYFFLAIVNLTDKFVIDNILKSSKAYTFLVCLLGSLIFLAAPWFLHWPGLFLLGANILTGTLFATALFFLYEALRRGEAARTIILIGGLIPIFSAIFSWLFVGDLLSVLQLAGLLFLLSGIFLVAFLPGRHSFWEKIWQSLRAEDYKKNSFILVILAALFYALFFSATKYVYLRQDFWSAFIWIRLGALISVLFFLLETKSRKEIIKNLRGDSGGKKHQKKNIFLFLFNQALGSLSFILQNYAIFLGPVAIITALQGFQYALMMFLAFFLGFFFKEYKEKFSWSTLIQKIIALILISIGLYLTSLNV
ncbi:MAG: EamA family transporter [Candidatus Falkowbacteria bacterium]